MTLAIVWVLALLALAFHFFGLWAIPLLIVLLLLPVGRS